MAVREFSPPILSERHILPVDNFGIEANWMTIRMKVAITIDLGDPGRDEPQRVELPLPARVKLGPPPKSLLRFDPKARN